LVLKKILKHGKKTQEKYFPDDEIVGILEDTPGNLQAAVEAYDVPGYQVSETDSGLSIVNHIVKGNLYDIKRLLEAK